MHVCLCACMCVICVVSVYVCVCVRVCVCHVARLEQGKSAFKILIGKPTEKRPLGRS